MLFMSNTPELNKLDYSIYRYITDHIDAVSYMSIRELSFATHTSTASILRFCKKFDCVGFSEFKIRLKLYYQSEATISIPSNNPSEYIEFFERSAEPNFQNKLTSAAKLLCQKEFILFLGAGTSETLAAYGALYFTNLSIPALKIADPSNYSPDWFAPQMLDKTGFIILSISGQTREIIDYTNHLTTKNTDIISISNDDNSPLAQISKLNIAYHIARETVAKNRHDSEKTVELTSQIPVIYIIESLAKEVSRLKQENKATKKA